jgi:hypothetical protein
MAFEGMGLVLECALLVPLLGCSESCVPLLAIWGVHSALPAVQFCLPHSRRGVSTVSLLYVLVRRPVSGICGGMHGPMYVAAD